MDRRLIQLTSVAAFEELLRTSDTRPVVLFKHSRACGTSAQALDELELYLDEHDPPDVSFAIVTVQTHREVSSAATTTLGIRHETPQVLLLRDGRVVWSASHYRVTADAVRAAIARFQPSAGVAAGS